MAISKHNELWNRYFSDFICYKLQVDSFNSSEGIVQEILHTFLGHLHQLEARERIIRLHIQLNICQLDLAKLVSLFRPLDKLNMVICSLHACCLRFALSYLLCALLHSYIV